MLKRSNKIYDGTYRYCDIAKLNSVLSVVESGVISSCINFLLCLHVHTKVAVTCQSCVMRECGKCVYTALNISRDIVIYLLL